MMRSMFSGVSGLKAHQSRMDVIGNNIANVNTVAFKSGRVTFQEIFSQTLKGAGAPDAATGRGGANPMQVGLGIGVNAVDTIMTRGSVQRTDNPTDLSIEGEGFMVVRGGTADSYKFTRAGNFGIDKLGNLVTGSGLNVQGWQEYTANTDGTFTFATDKSVEAINFYSDEYNKNKRMIAAQATSACEFSGNLDAAEDVIAVASATADNVEFAIPMTVYDALGNDYTVNVNFWKTASVAAAGATPASTTWSWGVDAPDGDLTSDSSLATGGSITFDDQGQITGTTTDAIIFTPVGAIGTGAFTVDMDFSKMTMYAADSSAKPTSIDGYPTGDLSSFSVGSDGIITGVYSNGQQQPLGLIAIASFENPAGLLKVGDNLYEPTTNSGDFTGALKAGSEGVGTFNPGTLEMSNVDLSKEFTDMIVTQRGFQANSRIITTSDEMLQELVGLKR